MFKHCGNHVRSPKFEDLGRVPRIFYFCLHIKGRVCLVWGKEGEHLVYQDEISHRE